MRRLLLAILALSTVPAYAGPGGCTDSAVLIGIGDEGTGITVSSTALGLTATVYAPSGVQPADMAVCQVATDAIFYRDYGGVPTATTGMRVASGSSFTICGLTNIRKFLAIRETNDANLKCAYYRRGD